MEADPLAEGDYEYDEGDYDSLDLAAEYGADPVPAREPLTEGESERIINDWAALTGVMEYPPVTGQPITARRPHPPTSRRPTPPPRPQRRSRSRESHRTRAGH